VKHNDCSVECIGSFADVSLWEIDNPIGSSSSNLGKWRGSVLGNDAVIVARELHNCGVNAKCHLLDPTDSDLVAVSSVLGPDAVVAVGGRAGEVTRSLCIEDEVSRRSWIFSRVPAPSGTLAKMDSDFVYVDYYPEFIEFLNQHLQHLESTARRVIVNLSALSPSREIPSLTIRPLIVQASVPRDVSVSEAIKFATQLREITAAQKALVTMGPRGAVLAIGTESWHCDMSSSENKTILGAGAVFSSEVIIGISKGLDQLELLESSVRSTALRLKSLK
jgi:hypothetical protein